MIDFMLIELVGSVNV